MPGGLPLNPVSVIGSFSILSPADVSVTTTPQALPAASGNVVAAGVDEIIMQNDSASTSSVKVGDGTRQTIVIAAGSSLVLPLRDPTKVFVATASGTATLHLLYRGRA